jgi:hypothetical protein
MSGCWAGADQVTGIDAVGRRNIAGGGDGKLFVICDGGVMTGSGELAGIGAGGAITGGGGAGIGAGGSHGVSAAVN